MKLIAPVLLLITLLFTGCANVGGGVGISGGTNSGVNVGGSIGVHLYTETNSGM